MNDIESLESRLSRISQQKEKAARIRSQEITAEKEERMKSNALVRWNALRNGKVLESDNFTTEEILLAESVQDISQLTIDENGHLCLADSKSWQSDTASLKEEMEKGEAEIMSGAGAALRRSHESLQNIGDLSGEDVDDTNVDAVQSMDSSESHDSDASEDGQTSPVEQDETEEVESEPQVLQDAKVMRFETLEMEEARIFFAVAKNPASKDVAYAYCLERGKGDAKENLLISQSNKTSRLDMVFYGIANALEQLMQPRLIPIKSAIIYADVQVGNEICKNSGNVIANPQSSAVVAYRDTLQRCQYNCGITIKIAPAEAHCVGQDLVRRIAKTLVEAPV